VEGFAAFVVGLLIVWAWVGRLKQRIEQLEQSKLDDRASARELTALMKRVAALEDGRTAKPIAPAIPPPVAPPIPPPTPPPAPRPLPVAGPVVVETPVVVSAPVQELPPPPVAPAASAPASRWLNWESLVGVQLFSAIAGIALLVAAVFFLKFSIEQGWLQPPVRAAIGVFVSIGLLIACELKAARRYPATANALDASAIAILFSTTFASHSLWHLIPGSVAFGLLALITAVAVLLAIRRNSVFIALLGLLGGFATPILLSTGENRPVQLFSYLLLLNVGLAWVAQKKQWPALTWLSLALTALYQWGWVMRFLDVHSVPLAMGIFLTFPLAALGSLRLNAAAAAHDNEQFRNAARYSALMPAVFGMYLVAVPQYAADPALLFGFVLLVDAGLLAISLGLREELLHTAGALTTLLTMAIWLTGAFRFDAAWMPALIFTAAFVTFYLIAPIIAARVGRPFGATGAITTYVAPLLLAALVALARTEFGGAHPSMLFLTLFGLLALTGWRSIAGREGALFQISSVVAVAAQAVWSATHLGEANLRMAVVIYSIFGIIVMAIPLIARRTNRALEPAWGSGAALLANLALLFFISLGFTSATALWALALLLAIMNAALFVESAGSRLPLLAQAGSVLSWVILGSWWSQTAGSVGVIPSVAVLTGLSLLTLAGHAAGSRASRAAVDPETSPWGNGLYLALVGQFFLMWMAGNRAWSLPPWPVFGALGVITLATSAASLYVRRASLHAAGAIGAGIVIAAWSTIAGGPPYATIAIAATAAVSAYAILWTRLVPASSTMAAAGASLVISVVATTTVCLRPGLPAFGLVTLAQAVFLAALLVVAWRSQWRALAVVAAGLVWIAVSPWLASVRSERSWVELLELSSVLYALFVAYPLWLGRRAANAREPFVAAVAATLIFVLNAREAFLSGPLAPFVGGVPIVAGAILALLLRQLLRLQPPGERDLGRLAIVAGSALACLTVAIPMQLDHQWLTIGWALEGAALAWLHQRISHRGLLYSSMALLAIVFGRLTMNPEILTYAQRGSLPILNWYLYTYLLSAVALIAGGRWLAGRDEALSALFRPSRWMPAAGVILLFLLLNIEIADFYATGPRLTFQFGVSVAQDLTYTIGWLVFGMALLTTGITTHRRAVRIAAVALIAVTTCKCFLYDLSSLGGLYRVASFVGLAISLSLVALTIQKFVIARPDATTA